MKETPIIKDCKRTVISGTPTLLGMFTSIHEPMIMTSKGKPDRVQLIQTCPQWLVILEIWQWVQDDTNYVMYFGIEYHQNWEKLPIMFFAPLCVPPWGMSGTPRTLVSSMKLEPPWYLATMKFPSGTISNGKEVDYPLTGSFLLNGARYHFYIRDPSMMPSFLINKFRRISVSGYFCWFLKHTLCGIHQGCK